MVRAVLTTPCPSDDVLGALVQQVLADDESERVRSHIDECGVCAKAVIAAVRGGALDTGVAPTLAQGTPSMVDVPLLDAAPIGTKVGRYDVRALLGAGGMGHVFEAYDAELDRAIALKVLRPELAVAQTLTERLVRESRLMAKVSHPAVITVYDVGRDEDTVFIAMELIRGETLGSYLGRARRPWREIVELFERAGAGLAAAHRAGIVHRDFKPENVLVELEGGVASRVVVTDFGIARATSMTEELERAGVARKSDPHLTSTGSAIGTPAYMAPEQLDGTPVDLRADVFAFSVSLWEALFGQRPFLGANMVQISAAMTCAPQPPAKHNVPRGVVRALERGLAIDPAQRWQDMTAFVRELLILRSRRRRVKVAASVLGLVGIAVASALLLSQPEQEDPCARATLAYDMGGLRAAISDPAQRDAVVARIDSAAEAWRGTHASTCKVGRQPAQPPTTTACLDARKLELLGIVDDVIADKGLYASRYVMLLGDPAKCASPAPSHSIAKIPADAALRRKVTALRYKAFAAETARDNAEFKVALEGAAAVVADAEQTWPLLHAEALYLLGTTESMGGDSNRAGTTLKRCAVVAESAHHDYIAANAWIQLVFKALEEDSAERALEYATYAEAASAKLGNPPLVESLLQYVKGSALTSMQRFDEAEKALRKAVELSTGPAISNLPEAITGIGFLYEQQGRYAEAVDAYRLALQKLPDTGAGSTSGAIIFRQRLAINLAMLGRTHEAEAVSREAVEIAEARLPPENIDRALARGNLAEVLGQGEKYDDALIEARQALKALAAIEGERSGRYGEMLQVEADLLHNLGRHAEAASHYARACDITAFQNGEKSGDHAQCELGRSMALLAGGDKRGALAMVDRVFPLLLESYGEPHPQLANALLTRGALRVEFGQTAEGIADLERAVTNFEQASLDAGHLANAKWQLAKALWRSDRERAKPLLEDALKGFAKSSLGWAANHAEASEWLATNGKPKRR
jgi:tetratricopeptide (TPR) repeat protein